MAKKQSRSERKKEKLRKQQAQAPKAPATKRYKFEEHAAFVSKLLENSSYEGDIKVTAKSSFDSFFKSADENQEVAPKSKSSTKASSTPDVSCHTIASRSLGNPKFESDYLNDYQKLESIIAKYNKHYYENPLYNRAQRRANIDLEEAACTVLSIHELCSALTHLNRMSKYDPRFFTFKQFDNKAVESFKNYATDYIQKKNAAR